MPDYPALPVDWALTGSGIAATFSYVTSLSYATMAGVVPPALMGAHDI